MKKTTLNRWRNVVASLVVGALAASSAFAQETALKSEHGATPEPIQEAALDKLLEGVDVCAPPKGVDEEYWASLIPEGNEITPERFALGKKLYFERRLSSDGTVSCATCHDIKRGFGDARPTSEGVGDQLGNRNAPPTFNVTFLHTMFWDGRSPTVEHQAMQPIVNPIEMGMPLDPEKIVAGIKDDPEYKAMFQAAYGRDVNYPDVGNALGVFERALVFVDNPFFRYMNGDENAISADAKEGWKIFNNQGRCASCHQISPTNPVGSNNKFHNIGVAAHKQDFETMASRALAALESDASEAAVDELALNSDLSELGRFIVTKNPTDIGAYRTSPLANVGVSGPYMHDGSMETLWDVVDHYNKGGVPNRYLDGGIEPLNLTDRQVDQLVAFLFTLTDVRFADDNAKEFAKQRSAAAKSRPERDVEVSTRRVLSFEKFDATASKKGE